VARRDRSDARRETHHVDGNDATDELVNAANATGEALFTRTVLDGRSSLRVCIGARTTERGHVEAAWDLLRRLAPPAGG